MFVLAAIVFIVTLLSTPTSLVYGAGTSPYLKDMFIGRCWQYETLQANNHVLTEKVNCRDLWTAFYKSFAFKDPCDMDKDSYENFFNMFKNKNKITNALFWSGAGELVHDFTFINDDYIVLEDTLTGNLLNGLTWCGSNTTADGLNYKDCESSGDVCNAMYPAWFQASANFALRASGEATVLLNASRSRNRSAYYSKSFFRSVEMPRLKVDQLNVLVATNADKPVRERCGTQSLIELDMDAKMKNMRTACVDQPKLVLRVFCLKFPKASQCAPVSFLPQDSTRESEETILWRTICFILIAVAAFLLLIIGIYIIRKYFITKNSNFKYLHNWSFSKKPMLSSNDDELTDNNNINV